MRLGLGEQRLGLGLRVRGRGRVRVPLVHELGHELKDRAARLARVRVWVRVRVRV